MAPKKASAAGAAALQPLDHNQETVSLREARSQKRKAVSPTLEEEELDQEIREMEMLHQQVQRKKEKMARHEQKIIGDSRTDCSRQDRL